MTNRVVTESTGQNQGLAALQGKVAIVTGAARGLGEAICHSLAEAGAAVIAGDLNRELTSMVADKVTSAGGEAVPLYLDVADERLASDAVSEAYARYGRLDVVINNAGVDVTKSIEELTFDEWDRVIRTNLRGAFVMSKRAMERMRRQKHGHIVNVVSTAAKRAWANASAYHASKWGLLGFTYALHVEGREHNVKVTAVIAGGMRTPFLLERFPDIDPSKLQDPRNVADSIRYVLTQPDETVIPELMVLPMRETSWP